MKTFVYGLISEIVDEVFFHYPEKFSKLPAISFFEENVSNLAYAEDEGYLKEYIFVFDIWAKKSKTTGEIEKNLIEILLSKNFIFIESLDVEKEKLICRNRRLRFRYIGG